MLLYTANQTKPFGSTLTTGDVIFNMTGFLTPSTRSKTLCNLNFDDYLTKCEMEQNHYFEFVDQIRNTMRISNSDHNLDIAEFYKFDDDIATVSSHNHIKLCIWMALIQFVSIKDRFNSETVKTMGHDGVLHSGMRTALGIFIHELKPNILDAIQNKDILKITQDYGDYKSLSDKFNDDYLTIAYLADRFYTLKLYEFNFVELFFFLPRDIQKNDQIYINLGTNSMKDVVENRKIHIDEYVTSTHTELDQHHFKIKLFDRDTQTFSNDNKNITQFQTHNSTRQVENLIVINNNNKPNIDLYLNDRLIINENTNTILLKHSNTVGG